MTLKTPSEVAPDLGETYWLWKDFEAVKEDWRRLFFDAVTEAARAEGLAQKTVQVPDDLTSREEAETYAARYNPGWLIIDADKDLGIILEEDPALKGWVEVVLTDPFLDRNGKEQFGYVVTKTITGGSVLVDTERMDQVDPTLFDKVTQYKGFGPDETISKTVRSVLRKMNWGREIREDLTDEQMRAVRDYSYEGSRSARLNVRYAKPDDTPGT